MNKLYLKDVSDSYIEYLLQNNNDFSNMVGESYMEDSYFWQSDIYDNCLGKESHIYIDYHDNYNSFFLRVRDFHKFGNNISKEIVDYIGEEYKYLYDYVINFNEYYYYLINGYEDEEIKETLDTDKTTSIEEYEGNCKYLLQLFEDYLHGFETCPSLSDLLDHYINCMKDSMCEEYYIDNDEIHGTKIYRDVAYTQTLS